MVELKRFEELKRKIEKIRKERDKAEGALDQVMVDLKEEFGCKTIKEAEARMAELKQDAEDSQEKYEAALEDFEKKWDGVLG